MEDSNRLLISNKLVTGLGPLVAEVKARNDVHLMLTSSFYDMQEVYLKGESFEAVDEVTQKILDFVTAEAFSDKFKSFYECVIPDLYIDQPLISSVIGRGGRYLNQLCKKHRARIVFRPDIASVDGDHVALLLSEHDNWEDKASEIRQSLQDRLQWMYSNLNNVPEH